MLARGDRVLGNNKRRILPFCLLRCLSWSFWGRSPWTVKEWVERAVVREMMVELVVEEVVVVRLLELVEAP